MMCVSSTAATTSHRVNQEGENFQVFLIKVIVGFEKKKELKSFLAKKQPGNFAQVAVAVVQQVQTTGKG